MQDSCQPRCKNDDAVAVPRAALPSEYVTDLEDAAVRDADSLELSRSEEAERCTTDRDFAKFQGLKCEDPLAP
jgi:hypothetical protein